MQLIETRCLMQVADHFNAEVVAGTIGSKQDAIDYLTWTFFYRRVLQNPSYYDLEDTEMESVSAFLSDMVERNMALLQVDVQASCSWEEVLSRGREGLALMKRPGPWPGQPHLWGRAGPFQGSLAEPLACKASSASHP